FFGAPAAGAVDVEGLLRDKRYTLAPAAGPERSLVFDGMLLRYHGETREIERFLLAHALAHVALAEDEPSCALHGDAPSPAVADRAGARAARFRAERGRRRRRADGDAGALACLDRARGGDRRARDWRRRTSADRRQRQRRRWQERGDRPAVRAPRGLRRRRR